MNNRGYGAIRKITKTQKEEKFEKSARCLHFTKMSDDNAAPAENVPQEDKTKNTVYVGSISFDTTEEGLRSFFEEYGAITEVRIPRDHSNRSKGFGFVQFENAEDANKACEKDGQELDGRTIKVNISQPKGQGERRGGDRHGGDRRGGDRYGDRRGGDRYGDRRGGDRYGGDRRGGRNNDRRGGY